MDANINATNNSKLYEKAMEAITAVFSDTTVSVSITRQNLNDLIGEIEIMIEALKGQ